MDKQKKREAARNINSLVLSNAVELGYQALKQAVGNDLADEVKGEGYQNCVRRMITVRLNQRLSHYNGERK